MKTLLKVCLVAALVSTVNAATPEKENQDRKPEDKGVQPFSEQWLKDRDIKMPIFPKPFRDPPVASPA